MKIGIVLQSNNPEHIWNSLRFGLISLRAGHQVTTFLLSEGVELEKIPDTNQFDVSEKLHDYRSQGGQILACGTCLKSREIDNSEVCPISTMEDLLLLIEESDKVLSF